MIGGTSPFFSRTRRTPMWASPRAPPPMRTRAQVFEAFMAGALRIAPGCRPVNAPLRGVRIHRRNHRRGIAAAGPGARIGANRVRPPEEPDMYDDARETDSPNGTTSSSHRGGQVPGPGIAAHTFDLSTGGARIVTRRAIRRVGHPHPAQPGRTDQFVNLEGEVGGSGKRTRTFTRSGSNSRD